MQLVIKSKNLELSDNLRQLVESKLGKVDRYFEDITEAVVELSYDRNFRNPDARHYAEVNLFADTALVIRAEARGRDLRSALDTLADVIQRQTVRHKEKLQQRGRVSAAKTVAEIAASLDTADAIARAPLEDEEEETVAIERRDIFPKPLSLDEALDALFNSDSDLFVFINSATNQVNVLHREASGRYVVYVPPGR